MASDRTSILLVEDNAADARLIGEMLAEGDGLRFTLRRASRLEEAIDLASRGPVDLMLLDLSLPDSQGLDTFTRAREGAPHLPIVVLTGLADTELAARAVREGAQDYLHKGEIDSPLLVRSLRYALERHRAERQLRESAEHLRTLSHAVEQSSSVVVITDTQGRIEYVNPRFTEVTGHPKDDVLGADLLEIDGIDPDRLPGLRRALATGREWRAEVDSHRKSGDRYRELASLSPIRDAEGRITHFIKVSEDVTQQRHLEDQLRQAQKMEAVGRLAGGIAHDFNNLLMVIMGYGDSLLTRLGPDGPLRKEAEEITRAADRAAVLTRQLLAVSRRQAPRTTVVDLNAVIREMEAMLRRLIGENIRLATDLSAAVCTVKADPGEMEQVLMNLAINARDAMPGGGRLAISTEVVTRDEAWATQHVGGTAGEHVVVQVKDSGSGMDEETRSRVFEPFYTTKTGRQGTGLGLSIVYGIVRHSGGVIDVQSRPGRGATFTIHLPLSRETPPAADEPDGDLAAWHGSETILLVEDEKAVRDLVRSILTSLGYTVLVASGAAGAESLARRRTRPLHLLVTDVVMPGTGGRVLAQRLARTRPDLKVLFMSGYTDDVVLRGLVESGAAFLQKPFTAEALARKVREVLAT